MTTKEEYAATAKAAMLKPESEWTLQDKVAMAMDTSSIDRKMDEMDKLFKDMQHALADNLGGMFEVVHISKVDKEKVLIKEPTMSGIVDMIRSGKCKKVSFLNGAGISVPVGIPDFRSKGGFYATLKPEDLTATPSQREAIKADPTYVLSRKLFLVNQLPYLEQSRPFILGTYEKLWKPSLFHFLLRLFADHQMLGHVFTQNIDGLDYSTGITATNITSVHGTMTSVECEGCGNKIDNKKFYEHVKANVRNIYGESQPPGSDESQPMECPKCKRGLCKPSIVMFGSDMPTAFTEQSRRSNLIDVDLLIVAGTSLAVAPANGVVNKVTGHCARLICNRESVGHDLGIVYGDDAIRDVWREGNCDLAALELVTKLGWLDELRQYKTQMCDASQLLLDQKQTLTTPKTKQIEQNKTKQNKTKQTQQNKTNK